MEGTTEMPTLQASVSSSQPAAWKQTAQKVQEKRRRYLKKNVKGQIDLGVVVFFSLRGTIAKNKFPAWVAAWFEYLFQPRGREKRNNHVQAVTAPRGGNHPD